MIMAARKTQFYYNLPAVKADRYAITIELTSRSGEVSQGDFEIHFKAGTPPGHKAAGLMAAVKELQEILMFHAGIIENNISLDGLSDEFGGLEWN
jgi:hypothetical protein